MRQRLFRGYPWVLLFQGFLILLLVSSAYGKTKGVSSGHGRTKAKARSSTSVQQKGKGEGWESQIIRRIKKGGVAAMDERGTPLFAFNAREGFVPASTIKVATALCAFHYLGKDFRFQTLFGIDPEKNLFIKGFGDPYLLSQEIERIAEALKEKGLNQVRDILVDGSFFQKDLEVPGAGENVDPYNPPLAAVSTNHNTILCEVLPSGRVYLSDPQTPMTPLAMKVIQDQKGRSRGRIKIHVHAPALYGGSLFKAFLERKGVEVAGDVREGTYPEGLTPFYVHLSSKTLEEVVREMLFYSSNFIANQLFLATGAKAFGPPASFEKGARAMEAFLSEQGGIRGVRVVEGSGLSRWNSVSSESMARIASLFHPHRELLKTRYGVFEKTGTLRGVYSLTGLFSSTKNGWVSFAILLNQPRNSRWEILQLLVKGLQ